MKKNICSLNCCPFCGGEARLVMEWDGMVRAECSRCRCGTLPYAEAETCQERWNHRLNNWISVKDALPEKETYCLTFCGSVFYPDEKTYMIMQYLPDAKTWNIKTPVRVFFWMPLPELPKGDEL